MGDGDHVVDGHRVEERDRVADDVPGDDVRAEDERTDRGRADDGDLVTHRATGLVVGLALPALGALALLNQRLFCLAFAVEEGCTGAAAASAAVLALLGALILAGTAHAYRTGDQYI